MAKLDLSKYGITDVKEILHNPSYEVLFEEETKEGLTGYDKGQQTELGAVNVMTGVYTGRSPKDKFIVMDETSKDTVWWTTDEYKNDNKPRKSRRKNSQARSCTLLTASAEPTRTPAWQCASSWKWHGRLTS